MARKPNKSQLSLLDVVSAPKPARPPSLAPPVAPVSLPEEDAPFPGLRAALAGLNDGDVWLVCRGRETARAVLLSLVGQGETVSWAGLRVTTLSAVLAEASGAALLGAPREVSSPQLPEGHPWAQKLTTRPGLRRLLRGHLERLHLLVAAGEQPTGLRPELAALLAADFGKTARVRAAQQLRRRVPSNAQVRAVGFGPDGFSFAGQVGHLERALLALLEARPLGPSQPPERLGAGSLRTVVLADPHAEARAIAEAALGQKGVLVLVPDAATASRVRAALWRNGVPVADRGFSALSHHALVALLRPLVPLVGSKGEEPVDYEAIVHLLLSPVLSRRALEVAEPEPEADPFAYEDDVLAEPEEAQDAPERARLSPRHARELLLRCRRVRATLPEWRDRLRGEAFELTGKEGHAHDEAQQAALRSRLASAQVLIDRLELLLECAREGTLAGLGRFVRTVGLSDKAGDRLGHAVARALMAAGATPATAEAFEEVLQGGLASSRLEEGAEVLAYEDYDGRRAPLLLCAGVHDKGLSRAPAPDPFLTEGDYAALGLSHGQGRVRERLALLRWAVSRAGAAVAFCAKVDASGRRVSLPAELAEEVALDGARRHAAYGLPLDGGPSALPELQDLRALGPSTHAAASNDSACEQLDAEWVRAGFRIHGRTPAALPEAPPLSSRSPLSRLLEEREPLLPSSLRPLLGYVGGPALPDRFVLSATRLADFTQCLFRAFLAHALRLKPAQDVEEEYTPSEIGDFLHGALAEATQGLRWVVPAAQLAATRQKALDTLCASTEQRFSREAPELGSDLSRSILEARTGVVERWKRHWARYLDARIVSVEEHNAAILRWAARAMKSWPEYLDALTALGHEELPTKAARERLEKGVAFAAQSSEGDVETALPSGSVLSELKDTGRNAEERGLVKRRLESAEGRARLAALFTRFRAVADTQLAPADGDLEVVEVELPFGAAEHTRGAPETLSLGSLQVPVQGRLDAVVLARGRKAGGGHYKVVDYKTGGPGQTATADVEALTHPQLLFYGLAFRDRLAQAPGELPIHPIREVGYDAVKDKPVRVPLSQTQLDEAADSFGALMHRAQEGSFALHPHPLRCPLLDSRAHCDFAEVCRFREAFRDEGADEEREVSDAV